MTTKPGENPWVSILIVCHNDGSWLPRCLQSVREQTLFPHVEVVLVDNQSNDSTEQVAKQLTSGWANALVLQSGGDHGFCDGTNIAAAAAHGTYLFVLNPDTWLEPQCIEQLYKVVEGERAGAGGPTVLNYEDNSLQSECPAGFDFCGNLLLPPAGTRAVRPFSAGGFFFIRRDLFTKIGGLDGKFFMYCEEQDLAWRIWISGERIVSVPSGRVHHRGGVGINPLGGTIPAENRTSTQKRFLANRNRLLVIAKNCHHLLLIMLFPCLTVVLLEGLATFLATRSWQLASGGCFSAITALGQMRGHIAEQRRRIAGFRRRGDLRMLRFFRLGFGRWAEVQRILRSGFPKFK